MCFIFNINQVYKGYATKYCNMYFSQGFELFNKPKKDEKKAEEKQQQETQPQKAETKEPKQQENQQQQEQAKPQEQKQTEQTAETNKTEETKEQKEEAKAETKNTEEKSDEDEQRPPYAFIAVSIVLGGYIIYEMTKKAPAGNWDDLVRDIQNNNVCNMYSIV